MKNIPDMINLLDEYPLGMLLTDTNGGYYSLVGVVPHEKQPEIPCLILGKPSLDLPLYMTVIELQSALIGISTDERFPNRSSHENGVSFIQERSVGNMVPSGQFWLIKEDNYPMINMIWES